MRRKLGLWIILFVFSIGFIFLSSQILAYQNPSISIGNQETQVAQRWMGHGMGGGMKGGGMMGGSDMRTIRQLFAYHNQIRRSVEEIPGGIRARTESDNPQVAALIQAHIPMMYQRIANRQGIPMIMMSSTLPAMAQNPNRYHRQFQITSKGILVTETSNAPEMVTVIRDHAREVTRFVEQGMPAMMDGMMRQ